MCNCESLIFDIDGTLWDPLEVTAEGYNDQLRKEGLEQLFVTPEALRGQFGKVIPQIADALFAPVPASERYLLMDRCVASADHFLKGTKAIIGYPNIKSTLETLSKDHRLFIASNCHKGYVEICMQKLGIQNHIRDHICFGDTRKTKGESIRMLMERNHVTSACYVGDTQGDADAVKFAGIPLIWASYGFGKVSDYNEKIDTFEQLKMLF